MKKAKYMLTLSIVCFFIKGAEKPIISPTEENIILSASEEQILEEKKKYLNLIVLFDPKQDETITNTNGALHYKAAVALSQMTSPIIASQHIIKNCCNWQIQHYKLLQSVKSEILKDYKSAVDKAASLCGSTFYFRTALVLSLVNLADWECYTNKNLNDLVLLIPKNYIKRHSNATNALEKIKDCGFNTDNINKLPS